jgi:hypothetical protein
MNYYLTVPSFTATFVFLKKYTFMDIVLGSLDRHNVKGQ